MEYVTEHYLGRSCAAASARSWASGNMGKSILPSDSSRLPDRLGRTLEDSEHCIRYGGGIPDAKGTVGYTENDWFEWNW